MRILHVNLNYNVSRLYHHLSEHLIKNGCDISVYFPTIRAARKTHTKSYSYLHEDPFLSKYDRLFFHKRNKKIVNKLKKTYNLNNFSLIHAHSLFSNGNVAYTLNKKYGIPYIVAVRNTDLEVFFKKLIYMRKKGIKILKQASKIICLSLPYKEKLLNKYVPENLKNEIEDKIVIIPNGIDQYWHYNLYSPKEIKDKKVQIISVGKINKRKNQLTTAKACEILINKFDLDIKLQLVGEIKDYKYFNKLKKYNFVKHIPHVPKEKLIKLYRSSDIFILPSINETFGLVYGEAMSQGLPVLYSKNQGFDRQFSDGKVGYSVDSRDASDIANKVIQVIQNYKGITSNSINLVQKFHWDKISKRYISIYEEIINDYPINEITYK